ncbi:MAG: NADH-quinone oxidoreductase subunit M [Aquificaceae bacterium]|nr:MAG: NADH-quinone oxidoreductase subunit M [Aquificaceae bacterium]
MFDGYLLSVLVWLPILGGLLTLFVNDRFLARPVALIVSGVTFVLSIPLWTDFDPNGYAMQFVELVPWIDSFSINYHLGVDGISMPLLLLNTFTTVLIVIAGWQVIQNKVGQYMAAFLIMEGIINGVFAAQDAILFYVFFEAMLIPMFIVIGIWGGADRVYATMKFFLYTFFGSVFMLVSLLYMYSQGNSFAIADLHNLELGMTAQILIFLSFLIAFGVKIPMWPVHTWLPDAHVQAPTGGSVVLAAIMLKIGGYGFLRFTLPMVPDASAELAWLVIFMSLVAVVYIGFIALVQSDMKKLVAYSSIAHMGFVTLGIFLIYPIITNTGASTGSALAMQGGMVQMVSHGFISGAMFLSIGVLYDRMHTREISAYGGVINRMPIFGALFIFFAMANTGLPGTSGFVGEFMVILSSFKANFWIAFLAASTLIVGAAYTLWLVKRVILGEVANNEVGALKDLNVREFFMLGVLAIAVLILGLWPEPLTHVMTDTIDHIIQQATSSKLPTQ